VEVLQRVLPRAGKVLEVASGTGEHAVYFARYLPHLTWQPTDPDPHARASIAEWASIDPVADGILPPLDLDVRREPWPVDEIDAVVCINMIHITPWPATLALLGGAARRLPSNGVLYLYGPFARGGRHTAPSNAEFDRSLRARDPRWGVRDLDDVVASAASEGLVLHEVIPMPANNLSVVLRRSSPTPASG